MVMADHNGGIEMRKMSKEIQSSVDDVPRKHHGMTPSDGPRGESLDSIVKIRRLFSFSQLFAFSLTFMSTWEGMNT